jgi:MFS transporter, OFA family, oxalate/formate antiporter
MMLHDLSQDQVGSSAAAPWQKVPAKGWITTFAGVSVNLCLGILYAWSVWKAALLANKEHVAGSVMTGINAGWTYMTDAQATWAYSICGLVFASFMVPGGRIQDKLGPRVSVTVGGLSLALGCIIAGYMRSYTGLIIGFGIFGGIGMGIGYSAPTPAAVKWFGPHKRGLIVGMVVGGFGGAAIYISALAGWLIKSYGISNSFFIMGIMFAFIVIVAGRLLYSPPEGYVPPVAPVKAAAAKRHAITSKNWETREMVKTWQFFALVIMMAGSSQAGLLVIVNATPMLYRTASHLVFFAAHAWMLASYGGVINLSGRVGTGFYSDKIGRKNAYVFNGIFAAVCLFLMPFIMKSGNVLLLFLVVGIAYWQYGGTLSLIPAFTADYFGPKNLGFNYGIVFCGGGVCFLMPEIGAFIKDATGSLDYAFYLSGMVLLLAVTTCMIIRRPVKAGEGVVATPVPDGLSG